MHTFYHIYLKYSSSYFFLSFFRNQHELNYNTQNEITIKNVINRNNVEEINKRVSSFRRILPQVNKTNDMSIWKNFSLLREDLPKITSLK